jgi:hypothetical protein
VSSRIEKLSKDIEKWDKYMQAVLQAAAEKTSDDLAAADKLAAALAHCGSSGSDAYKVVRCLITASSVAKTDAASVGSGSTQLALQGGSSLATQLTLSFSAVTLVCGLVETIKAGKQMWSGNCDAADSLDGQADRFCAMLMLMSETARGTTVHKQLQGKLPSLVLLQVGSCELPQPSYRPGDEVRKAVCTMREDKTRAYFQFRIGNRRRCTSNEPAQVTPKKESEIGRAVLMRVFDGDAPEVNVRAFDKRGIQSFMMGDPRMGKRLKLQLENAGTWNVTLKSEDGKTTVDLTYQILRHSPGSSTSNSSKGAHEKIAIPQAGPMHHLEYQVEENKPASPKAALKPSTPF